MLDTGMDLPLLDWLNTYTFPAESRFSDLDSARTVCRKLAHELIAWGTTRVSLFSSLHTDATLILMEELERAGVTVVHCPDSNPNLSSGFAPVRAMLNEGLKAALGSDIAGGDHLSLFDVAAAAGSLLSNDETNPLCPTGHRGFLRF